MRYLFFVFHDEVPVDPLSDDGTRLRRPLAAYRKPCPACRFFLTARIRLWIMREMVSRFNATSLPTEKGEPAHANDL
jgi:hypothetical protein